MTEPSVLIPLWKQDITGSVYPSREADYWRPAVEGNRSIDCTLCYRKCRLDAGTTGWCGYRHNHNGQMHLVRHGELSCVVRQQRGYQVDPFLTYKPGALSLFVGGVNCTAGCAFCMSTEITWNPEKLRWVNGRRRPGNVGGWYGYRGMMHPAGVMEIAELWGVSQVLFGINEPTLTFEFTHDVARLARGRGLDVLIETNGFTLREAIQKIGPFVSAIDLGIKGSGDPEFYDRFMRSAGAMPYVLAAAKSWRAAGVHLIIGDVIAPPHMQSQAVSEQSQARLYDWIAEELGPLTPLLITPMMQPGPQEVNKSGTLLLGRDRFDIVAYMARIERAVEIARAAGLHYAHQKSSDEAIRCHECGHELLRFRSPLKHCAPCVMPTHFCPWWTHSQSVTVDGRCAECGTAVPIVVLSEREIAQARRLLGIGDGRQGNMRQMDMQKPSGEWIDIDLPVSSSVEMAENG